MSGKLTDKQAKNIKKLEGMGEEVYKMITSKTNPHLKIPIRSLSNVHFDEAQGMIQLGDKKQKRYFFNLAHSKKFMQQLLVAHECKELIGTGKTTSIRDLFYMLKRPIKGTGGKEDVFSEQNESDPVIEDLEVALDILREDLHLQANSKGSCVGQMTIVDSGDKINLAKMGSGGWSIPSIVEPEVIEFKDVSADYILFIEKDAVWRRFNEDKYWKKHNCIIMHGQGMAARGNRRLVYRMSKELGLPVYCLVDNDPWGLYIYSVLKQGSINLAYESKRMAVPKARFIGLSSFDQEQYKIPKNVALRLKDVDIKRCKEMLKYDWFQKKSWKEEINHMLKNNVKLELEALSRRGISFITKTYLPEKIKSKDWLN